MNRSVRAVAVTRLFAWVFGMGAVLAAGISWAGPLAPEDVDFTIEASSGVVGDELALQPTLVENPDGTFSAVGEAQTSSYALLFDMTIDADPALSGSFTLRNLSTTTQSFALSATLGVLPIAGPTRVGGSFEGTYTDTDTDPADIPEVTIATGLFYQASIDGVAVASLGSFTLNAFGGEGVEGTISPEAFGTPIPSQVGPGVSGFIALAFPGFTLSPGDTVRVPFEFMVVPEPPFASLFALGATLFFIARRKKLPI